MKGPFRISILILARGAWGMFGYMTWSYGSQIGAMNARIAEQEEEIANANTGKMALDAEATRVGEEMKALPDSIRAISTGTVIHAAQSLAKREAQFDGQITRAKNRIRNATQIKQDATARLLVWDIVTGVAGLTLLGLFFVLRRSG